MPHKICIVGLGYVGLPLAHAFAKKGYETMGYDISQRRIEELQQGHDRTRELTDEQLNSARIRFSADPSILSDATVIILAIPTPVDEKNNPDLSLLNSATHTVGKHLQKGAIVVYESTVYPGVTEDFCGPILEKESGLKSGRDFRLGYSPERINPGDKEHTIDKILKIVAAQDAQTLETLSELYGSIVSAGIHRAPSIKVAEMAKAIENAQRDLNVAFVNEIAVLCGKIGIPTSDVFKAAGTKWNFLKFTPGLVGGHCIGVDPYYLVEKDRQLGMHTHVITAGRTINDGMSAYVARRGVEATGKDPKGLHVLVLGMTFKENIPDTRNSKAFDVVKELAAMGCDVRVHDPQTQEKELKRANVPLGSLTDGLFDVIFLLVAHKEYCDLPLAAFIDAMKKDGVIFDLKSILDQKEIEKAGRVYRAL